MTEMSEPATQTGPQPVAGAATLAGLRVVSVTPAGAAKRVSVETRNGDRVALTLHRFAMVGERDRLIVGDGLERRVWVVGENGSEIPVSPLFALHGTHVFAGEGVETRVVELSTKADFRDYAILEAFHYRGLDLSSDVEGFGARRRGTGGRRAVLLLQLKLAGQWTSAGYVELQMPLMMAKPRHLAFARLDLLGQGGTDPGQSDRAHRPGRGQPRTQRREPLSYPCAGRGPVLAGTLAHRWQEGAFPGNLCRDAAAYRFRLELRLPLSGRH